MELDKDIINEIIRDDRRFLSAYSDPEPYFMYSRKEYTEDHDEKIIDIYYEKLRYAVQNTEKLVNEAFREEFYDFYGVNKNAVISPEQMKFRLVFDSFTMDTDDMTIAVYFSNESFMFGHFIEAHWDADWNFKSCWINHNHH